MDHLFKVVHDESRLFESDLLCRCGHPADSLRKARLVTVSGVRMEISANRALVELAEGNLEEFPSCCGITRLHRLEQLLESRPEIRLHRTILSAAFDALAMSFLRGFSMSHLTLFPARAIPFGTHVVNT